MRNTSSGQRARQTGGLPRHRYVYGRSHLSAGDAERAIGREVGTFELKINHGGWATRVKGKVPPEAMEEGKIVRAIADASGRICIAAGIDPSRGTALNDVAFRLAPDVHMEEQYFEFSVVEVGAGKLYDGVCMIQEDTVS